MDLIYYSRIIAYEFLIIIDRIVVWLINAVELVLNFKRFVGILDFDEKSYFPRVLARRRFII